MALSFKQRIDRHDRELAAIRKLLTGMKMRNRSHKRRDRIDERLDRIAASQEKLDASQRETDRMINEFIRSLKIGNGHLSANSMSSSQAEPR